VVRDAARTTPSVRAIANDRRTTAAASLCNALRDGRGSPVAFDPLREPRRRGIASVIACSRLNTCSYFQ